jgi:hypothetical protein
MVIVEKLVEWRLAGETEVLGENLPRSHLSTTYPTWLDPGSNPGRRGGKPATNRLSYGAASGLGYRYNKTTVYSKPSPIWSDMRAPSKLSDHPD